MAKVCLLHQKHAHALIQQPVASKKARQGVKPKVAFESKHAYEMPQLSDIKHSELSDFEKFELESLRIPDQVD